MFQRLHERAWLVWETEMPHKRKDKGRHGIKAEIVGWASVQTPLLGCVRC